MKVFYVSWNDPKTVFHEILWKKNFTVYPSLKKNFLAFNYFIWWCLSLNISAELHKLQFYISPIYVFDYLSRFEVKTTTPTSKPLKLWPLFFAQDIYIVLVKSLPNFSMIPYQVYKLECRKVGKETQQRGHTTLLRNLLKSSLKCQFLLPCIEFWYYRSAISVTGDLLWCHSAYRPQFMELQLVEKSVFLKKDLQNRSNACTVIDVLSSLLWGYITVTRSLLEFGDQHAVSLEPIY